MECIIPFWQTGGYQILQSVPQSKPAKVVLFYFQPGGSVPAPELYFHKKCTHLSTYL